MKFSRNLILLLGCLLTTATLSAQTIDSESNVPSYKRVYVFNAGIGFGMPDMCGGGFSSWDVPKDEDRSGFTSSLQLMTFSPRSAFGYGAYYYHYRGKKQKYENMDEASSFHYVAPQVSFLKRQTAFERGVGYINAGVGYVRHQAKGTLMPQAEPSQTDYRTRVSGIGCNIGLAYEYIFDSNIALRLSVDGIYARLKGLHQGNGYVDRSPVRPKENIHLFVPSLELGLSYYLFHR